MANTNKSIIGSEETNQYKLEIVSPEELLAKYCKPTELPKGSSKVRTPKKEEQVTQPINQTETPKEKDNYIYVPSINLWVSKERNYLNSNFNQCKSQLHSNNERMPTIPEFREFLNYTKINAQDIYKEITEVRNPWRSEWLDADFKLEGKDLFMYYHEFDSNGKIIPKKVKLDSDTLRENKTPGISLDSWLADATSQGLPKKGIANGSLYYWQPGTDNNSVARFWANSGGADLNCDGGPSDSGGNLGVRAVRR